MLFEVCANSVLSAMNAEAAGADRIELCANLASGGTTPSFGTLSLCREKTDIPINVLIRPRSGDFLYSDMEFEDIKRDVLLCKQLEMNAVVCGFLNADGSIDLDKTAEIMELAYPMQFTFHRAFDLSRNCFESLSNLMSIGISKILTSGTKKTAFEGKDILAKLVETAGDKIIIMPGSGINANNIAELAKTTKAKEYHFSASACIDSKMTFRKENVLSTVKEDFSTSFSDVETIKSIINKL